MRLTERLLSLLLALAIVVAAVLLALEVGWAVAGREPLLVQWRSAYTSGTTDGWDTTAARVTAAAVLAAGLVLLVVALKPRRATRLAMTSTDDGVDAAVTRKSVRSALLGSARQVDGISGASATVSRRRASVSAQSRLGSADSAKAMTGQLEQALTSRLDALQLARPLKVRGRVRPARSS